MEHAASVLCRILTGRWCEAVAASDEAAILSAAVEHRVHVLLADRSQPFSADGRAFLDDARRREAVVEHVQANAICSVLDALCRVGVKPVLFKGAPLAYTHYPQPYSRPRNDVDMLIRREEVEPVRRVMEQLGYRPAQAISGDRVTHQFQYARSAGPCVIAEFDVHWRLANPVLFADVLSYDEIAGEAIGVASLHPHARTPGAVHSLFIACVHRVAHHQDRDHLLWLYDIHLLAERMTPEQWRAFTDLARRTSTRAVCASGLLRAVDAFGTRLPGEVREALEGSGFEPSSAFLGGGLRRIDIELSNFRHLTSWRARGGLVLQHLFPAPSYMLGAYGVRTAAWLPALYVHRIARGAVRWLRPA